MAQLNPHSSSRAVRSPQAAASRYLLSPLVRDFLKMGDLCALLENYILDVFFLCVCLRVFVCPSLAHILLRARVHVYV